MKYILPSINLVKEQSNYIYIYLTSQETIYMNISIS